MARIARRGREAKPTTEEKKCTIDAPRCSRSGEVTPAGCRGLEFVLDAPRYHRSGNVMPWFDLLKVVALGLIVTLLGLFWVISEQI